MMLRKAVRDLEGQSLTLRFTGKAGGTEYCYDDGKARLKKGQTLKVVARGHWLFLLASGDAEVVR